MLNLKNTLRRLFLCDAQACCSLHRDTPLHHEVFALLLKEPWLVDLFGSIRLQFKTEQGSNRRMYRKQVQADRLEAKTSFRRIVKELLTKASEMMEEPTLRMKMERRTLCDQYGLIWFGGIMTFKHLGLVVAARDGATRFKWGQGKLFPHWKLRRARSFR